MLLGGIAGGPGWGNQGFTDDRWGQNRQPQRQFGGPPPPGFGFDFRGAPLRGPSPPFGHPPPFGRPPPPGPPLPGSPPPGNRFGLQEIIGRVGNMAADIAGSGGGEDVVRSFRSKIGPKLFHARKMKEKEKEKSLTLPRSEYQMCVLS
ncbi:hypothetical protein TELCIR_24088 [Teladorsagia circumcincta]|uniref:Uncharacterized protein n=1 Tax=Teladorsagia circumcincta TaxID=45464 RepID=A0A2G9T9J2_TELCI|nr:hypothetical protein TELCIR_24088 [Teladorsagia circumcincta]